MKKYYYYSLLICIGIFSCTVENLQEAETDSQIQSNQLIKYVRSNLDINVNPPVAKDSTIYQVANNQIESITSYNVAGDINLSQFNYQAQKLTSIEYFANGISTGNRDDFQYDSMGYLIEHLSSQLNDFKKYRLQRNQDTTYVDLEISTDGINFTPINTSPLFKLVLNQNGLITYSEARDNTNGVTNKSHFIYDSMDNLVFETSNSVQSDGTVISNISYTMSFAMLANPISSLRDATYSKYANNVFYPRRRGNINITVGPQRISTQLLDTYEYSQFTNFSTAIINETNTNGFIERITYETRDSSNILFSSFKEEFYYQ